jgi:hypothetical protein
MHTEIFLRGITADRRRAAYRIGLARNTSRTQPAGLQERSFLDDQRGIDDRRVFWNMEGPKFRRVDDCRSRRNDGLFSGMAIASTAPIAAIAPRIAVPR